MALAFALYAGVRDAIGPVWGAAAVAGVTALFAVILALVLTREAHPDAPKGDNKNLTAQLLDLARERPLVAVGVVGAAAAVVIRNPRILTAVIAALFAPHPGPPRR